MSKEGFWRIDYSGRAGAGFGILVFDTNLVFGVGIGGVFDGTYEPEPHTNKLRFKGTWTTENDGTMLVQGGPPVPRGFTFEFQGVLPREMGVSTRIACQTSVGTVVVDFKKIRDFPPTV